MGASGVVARQGNQMTALWSRHATSDEYVNHS
jgi:hypothetical protein